MKIAIFHELPVGGALRSHDALALELSLHHSITQYSVTETLQNKRKEISSRQYLFVPTGGHGFLGRMAHDFLDIWRLAFLHLSIALEIDAGGFDLVLVHPSRWTQAPFLLSFLRTPTVYYCQEPLRLVHDPLISNIQGLPLANSIYEKLNRMWRGWIDYVNTRSAGSLVANSVFSAKWIERVYKRKPHVCYLGVDTSLFHPMKVAKKYDVLFLGVPVSIEGFDLLESARAISPRKWNVHIVKRRADGKGISDAQLVRTMNQSRVVVCLSKNEPFGLTVLEAGSCGVPVVAVCEGGLAESVKDKETGILISRNLANLVHAVNTLLANSTLRKRMGVNAREHMQREWTWSKSAKKLEHLLMRAVAGREKKLPTRLLDAYKEALIFGTAVVLCLFLFRVSFRYVRGFFSTSIISKESVGYAQYTGYPMYFETYLFNSMFAVPMILAILFRGFWKRKI